MKRVVVTGFGAVSPLGCSIEGIWSRILSKSHGISRIADVAPSLIEASKASNVHVAGFVPRGEDPDNFDEKRVFGRSVSREMALFSQFAVYASDLAVTNAGLDDIFKNREMDMSLVGTSIGTGGIGSLFDITDGYTTCQQSIRKLSPYFVPKILVNMPSGQVSLRHGLKGPVHSVATACAAGTHSIGDSYNFIKLGYADIMLCGGAEASIDMLSMAGFSRMRALSSKEDPSIASSPFDASRSGFVMGEGAGVLVLESLESALKRKAPIIAEICGYSLTGDAHHLTAPSPFEGGGAQRAMIQVLKQAGISPNEVDYINCHATSTPLGDGIEASAIDSIFGNNSSFFDTDSLSRNSSNPLLISSTKGATGHLLGAAGAIESMFTCLAIRDGQVPPTLNLVNPDPTFSSFEHVTTSRAQSIQYALKNSFGFGGTNAVLCFKKYE